MRLEDRMVGIISIGTEEANIGYRMDPDTGLIVLTETRISTKRDDEKEILERSGLGAKLPEQTKTYLQFVSGSILKTIAEFTEKGGISSNEKDFKDSISDIIHGTDSIFHDAILSRTDEGSHISYSDDSKIFKLEDLKEKNAFQTSHTLSKRRLPQVFNDLLVVYTEKGKVHYAHRGGCLLYHADNDIQRITKWQLDQNMFNVGKKELKIDIDAKKFTGGSLVLLSKGILPPNYPKMEELLDNPRKSAEEHAGIIKEEAIKTGAKKGYAIVIRPYERFSLGNLSSLGGEPKPPEVPEIPDETKLPYIDEITETVHARIEDMFKRRIGTIEEEISGFRKEIEGSLKVQIKNVKDEMIRLVGEESERVLEYVSEKTPDPEDIKTQIEDMRLRVDSALAEGLGDLEGRVKEASRGDINLSELRTAHPQLNEAIKAEAEHPGEPEKPYPAVTEEEPDEKIEEINMPGHERKKALAMGGVAAGIGLALAAGAYLIFKGPDNEQSTQEADAGLENAAGIIGEEEYSNDASIDLAVKTAEPDGYKADAGEEDKISTEPKEEKSIDKITEKEEEPETKYLLGESETAKGNMKKGRKMLFRANQNKSISAYMNALQYFEKALELNPDNPKALFSKGRAEYNTAILTEDKAMREKYTESAIRTYEECLEMKGCRRFRQPIRKNLRMLRTYFQE